ncbi:ATP-binding protein [Paenibacillus qinlingensis]|uniref:ATP-binding protein n=1 Tax=Paenibacillus qinlingensis TaxID=1837343 RepID=UPI001562FD6F|nr:ATP-binding protein [Paenibacillus qinlingensis]NQX58549.1 ATP-binding protein [Paenibacillus qinlingensis]
MNTDIEQVDEILRIKAFSKIGEVFEVEGKRVLIKVDNQKNLSNLFFNGEIYRNVGIGSYIKVKKDFIYLIGKVNKEFIKENINSKIENKQLQYDRFVELLIIGFFENGLFVRGIKELPFLYNEAFLMSEHEVKKIFQLSSKYTISIGKALFEEVSIEAGITKLFASHIGIFGNTGSGKSNTLARLYHNLLTCDGIDLSNSKIIFLDFNGEYSNENTVINGKTNIILSTRTQKDRLKIKKDWLDDEFWGILLQATERTQKPFIRRTLNYQETLSKSSRDETLQNIVEVILSLLKIILNNGGVSNKEVDTFNLLKQSIKEFFSIGNEDNCSEIFRYYTLHNGALSRFYNPQFDIGYTNYSGKIYFGANNTNSDLELQSFRNKLIELVRDYTGGISDLGLFELALGLRLAKDVLNNIAHFEHVSPIIHRFQKRKLELEKLFEIGDIAFDQSNPAVLTSISLKDVNTEMKKLIPLLITKKIYDSHKENHSESVITKTLHLVIDEAHNILSDESFRESESWKDYRLEVFEEIIKEGRKFGVFLTLSSQRPSDISNTIISQLHNVFIHRLINNNDLLTMSKTISFLDKTSFDSLSILPPGACVFTGTATETPIVVQIPLLDKSLQPMSETVNLERLWGLDSSHQAPLC